MNRTPSLLLFSASIGLVAACGKVVVDTVDLEGVNEHSGSGGAAATTGGTGGDATVDAGMCTPPPPPSPTLPTEPGCYENMGSGWYAVPCFCDLWLQNTTPASLTATIQLSVTPPDQVPTLTGTADAEVAFEDPDASWYATWTKQAGNGKAFTVTNAGGTTYVRMGQNDVALAPVHLAACETRQASAHVFGSAQLNMKAALGNGMTISTTTASCSNPPPTQPD